MEEPDSYKSGTNDVPDVTTSSQERSTSRRSTPGRSTSARSPSSGSTHGRSTPGRSTPGRSTPGRSVSGRSTPDRSTTPEPPPVPPATYHWEEVRRKRTVGGYPWTHLNKPPFDEKTWVKYERDHVYEPVTPTKVTSAEKTSSSPSLAAAKLQTTTTDKAPAATKDDSSRHFLRIPLTEELVMADEDEDEDEDDDDGCHGDGTSGSERAEENDEDEDEDDDEDDREERKKGSDESIDDRGEKDRGRINSNSARMKAFQQKVKVKADVLRTKLQGVTKRKPKQKIVMEDSAESDKRKSFASAAAGKFATLPKKFTFNAPKVNFSAAFGHFARTPSGDGADDEAHKRGRFSLPRRFAGGRFSRTSSESPEPSRSATAIGASRASVPSLRTRTWSDASKASSSSSQQQPKQSTRIRITDFGTYPRIFSKRRKTDETKTPSSDDGGGGGGEPRDGPKDRSSSFRRRFFRSHTKESTPAPATSDERQRQKSCSLAVEEEGLQDDALHGGVSKESLAEFGDSDLQEVISLGDDGCNNNNKNKDTVSLRSCLRTGGGGGGGGGGVIEEIDSDEFFLREKGLSRGDVHISNYLSSEIRHVFRSNRTRSVEGIDGGGKNNNNNGKDDGVGKNDGFATPVRPSRTNSLRRPQKQIAADRFSTMPKSFGGTARSQQPTAMTSRPEDDDRTLENIITSQTFEPSHNAAALPSTFRVPWRTAASQEAPPPAVTHMPPKPPTRQRMTKFSTFDTRSMIDLSRKRSQSQIGFPPSMNFSDTVPKAPLRRSRTSLAGSERDVSTASDAMRPQWTGAGGVGAPTPPLRRSRMSLTGDLDAEESRSATLKTTRDTPPRPPPPAAGYATVDKSLLMPPQSPARHRRKKSYDVIKSQEFGAFFTIPRSYSFNFRTNGDAADGGHRQPPVAPAPSRPARAYNTLGPSRPLRRRLPAREHEYGDVQDTGTPPVAGTPGARSSSPEDGPQGDGPAAAKGLFSGDVIEKMKLRPLPSPPPPPRAKPKAPGDDEQYHLQQHQHRRNTDSALVPFLDRREASATSSDDFFADVSRALLASAACNNTSADGTSATATTTTATTTTAATTTTTPTTDATNATTTTTIAAAAGDDVSVGVQTDPLPDGYELDDVAASRCSSRASSAAATDRRPTSRISAEYSVERPASRTNPVENGYATMPQDLMVGGGGGVICAQRINVEELQVCRMTVADVRGQRMGVDDVKIAHLTGSSSDSGGGGVMVPSLEAACTAATAAVLQSPLHHPQDDDASSSRVSSMYPELDSDEDRASVLAAPTPPRRRSKPSAGSPAAGHRRNVANGGDRVAISGAPAAVDLSAAAADPSITELSCQLFRLCHSNVCSLFNKVVQQVVPEDTEKRRDLQAALCFLSIILAGLLILGFGNEKTIHHHHWDFQFPPPNQ